MARDGCFVSVTSGMWKKTDGLLEIGIRNSSPFSLLRELLFLFVVLIYNKKLSSTCKEFKFRGWHVAAFRLGQETHQILFEFQQTR